MHRTIGEEALFRSRTAPTRTAPTCIATFRGRALLAAWWVLACLLLPPSIAHADPPQRYDKAAQEIARVKRYARPLSQVLFDLDHFKQVNDRSGHLAGHEVVKGFVGAVVTTLREAGFFARFGGDEFVALLPETSHNDAALLARRVLVELRARRIGQAGEGVEMSFSAGVAEFEDDASIDDWIGGPTIGSIEARLKAAPR